VNGKDYRFIDKCEFAGLKKSGYFMEWADVHGNYYGTPKGVYKNIEKGTDALFVIDVQGGMCIKKKYPESILIFMIPPSVRELKKRIVRRNTEPDESLEKRLVDAIKEMKYMLKYDYCVVNDKVKDAARDIISIITAEKLKVRRG
jgi:guanylate kinase